MAKAFALALIGALLAGCAADPIKEVPPVENFKSMDLVTSLPDVSPVPAPEKPKPSFIIIDGQDSVAFLGEEGDRLNSYLKVLQANTEIAGEGAKALRAADAERRALIELGRLTEERLNYVTQEWAVTREELRHSETMRSVQSWVYQLLLIAAAIGLAL